MRIFTSYTATFAFAMALASVPDSLPAQDNGKHSPSHLDPYVRGPGDENSVIKEVRHNLLMLPYYGVFDNLGFNVNGGTVTLTGQVTRPTLKDDAGNTVKKLKDVSNVVNNIEVLPLSPTDDGTRIAVYRAIYGDPSLSARYAYSATPSIHIIVKNGNVRLEGVVANSMDKHNCRDARQRRRQRLRGTERSADRRQIVL